MSGTATDPFLTQVAQAQAELAEAVERAGLARDPYRFLVGALAHVLGVFPTFVRRLDAAVEQSRQPLDAAALARLEAAAASGAERRAAELARVHSRRTVLCYAGCLVAGLALAAGGGVMWGRATVQQTERRVAAAFTDGPEVADRWVVLMENNDLPHALSSCTGTRTYADQAGRRICLVALYIDPPRRRASEEQRR